MSPSRLVTVTVVTLAAVVSGALSLLSHRPFIDWLFAWVVFSCVGLVARQSVRTWLSATREHRHASDLRNTQPTEVASAAVSEERRRLTEEITASLRASLHTILRDAKAAANVDDPRALLADIREHTRIAASELRRQLGILHDDHPPASAAGLGISDVPVITRRDLLLAVAVTTLAVAESLFYPRLEGVAVNGVSLMLTVLIAATTVARRRFPGLAALAAVALYLAAIPLRSPIRGGFWCVAAVAGLIWVILTRQKSTRFELGAAAALCGGSAVSTWLLNRDNLSVWLAMLVVAIAFGLLVRWGRSRAVASRQIAEQRQLELDVAAGAAIAAERSEFAGELHDVVSHAVGLIAVQGGAAEVVWAADPQSARRSIEIILTTAHNALAELNRLRPLTDRPGGQRTYADLEDLVQRIRLAGTQVHLEIGAEQDHPLHPVAYRVVQEALTNVVRHAPGASARVKVSCEPDGAVTVEVTDNGAPTQPFGRGYGLVGLAERVKLAGGVLEIGPAAGERGFRVAASLPPTVGVPT